MIGYEYNIYDEADTLGIDWGSVLGQTFGQVGSAGLALLAGAGRGPSGCLVSQLSKKDEIERCGQTVMSQFAQVEAQIGLLPATAIVAAAEEVAALPWQDRFFKQSVSGNAKTALDNLKASARTRADAIRSAVSAPASSAGASAASAGAGVVPGPSTGVNIDTSTVLLIGGGLLVLVLLMRQ